MSTQELINKEVENLPEPLQREVYDFAHFLRLKSKGELQLLEEFEKRSGLPVLLNTSFNVKGQPIVCTPKEALDTFLFARLDVLVMGDFLVVPKRTADGAQPGTDPALTASDT